MSSLYGLVVCGGKSTRMGTDKSILNYHGQPQRYHLYNMLNTLCERSFISCNGEQATTIPDKYAVIVDDDKYGDIGPMKALLTAIDKHPNKSFLVVGCDYPYQNENELRRLIEVSIQLNRTTAFYNIETKIKQPLLTVYQQDVIFKLHQYFNENMHSLRKALELSQAHLIEPINYMSIVGIDNLKQHDEVMKELRTDKNKHI